MRQNRGQIDFQHTFLYTRNKGTTIQKSSQLVNYIWQMVYSTVKLVHYQQLGNHTWRNMLAILHQTLHQIL